MSITPEEYEEIKGRAQDAVGDWRQNEEAARVGMDVLILLLIVKLEKERGVRKK